MKSHPRHWLFLLLLFVGAKSYTQETREERINEFECRVTEWEDSAKIHPLLVLAEAYTREDLDKADRYLERARKLIEAYPSDERYYEYYAVFGTVCLAKGQYEEGVQNMEKALPYLRRLHDFTMLSHLYNNLGSIAKWLNKLDDAHAYLDSSLAIKTRLNDTVGIAVTQNNLANLYQVEAKYERAISLYFESLKFYETQKEKSLKPIASLYVNISSCYANLRDYGKALDMSFRVARLLDGSDLVVEQAAAYTNIVSQYINLEKTDSARFYSDKYRERIMASSDPEALADYHFNEGCILDMEGRCAEALKNFRIAVDHFEEMGNVPKQAEAGISEAECLLKLGRYGEGLKRGQEVYDVLKESELLSEKLKVTHVMYKLHQAAGNTRDALKYFEEYTAISDEVYTQEKNRIIEEIEAKYKVEKAEMIAAQKVKEVEQEQEKNRILSQQNEFQRTRNLLLFVAVVLLVLVITLIVFAQKMRAKSHRQEKKMIQAKQQMAEMELENERLHREQLDTRVHHQYRSLQDMANHIVEKNELIKQLNDVVRKIKGQAEAAPVKDKLGDLEFKIRNSLNIERDRTQLNQQIVDLNSKFASEVKAKHPDLSDRDIRLLALLRLGLSSKEIAGLFNISSKSVDQSRYRLRKKLDLQTDSNLVDYLHSL